MTNIDAREEEIEEKLSPRRTTIFRDFSSFLFYFSLDFRTLLEFFRTSLAFRLR